MEKARRRRVPAFGEWNYNYHHHEPEATAAAAWYATPEPEACSDVWFRYSPPPRNPTPKKTHASRRRRPDGDVSRERARASSDAAAAKSGGSRYQVWHVDEDLYKAPSPEPASHRRPRKKWSMWMGCLGLNSCVAS
ncbi:hypothetical protein CFC21_066642 [Triticum aestivum]|uniref:RIN4 pathogenic type III effector avirulence factor Avr cleavage site domain-containing protein n=3 Tax=Triticum TaxID=4564 RepID=A0A9R1H6Z5_WHEAT|nr:uncharacterized protein LOC119297609 [Triticum dicoccoides]XP_044385293.1 uncharacterized protein LOC123107374 [Triticum aestivum]KAF7059775.1 hypothetical protein CFC21_066639 [Triticum aestivum]KAF7059779.1 hypothetical protein CFC21_066642 [Triticum aestivum]VAI19533.1 unnamed protein product [Triticum turgidum subsp. durum]